MVPDAVPEESVVRVMSRLVQALSLYTPNVALGIALPFSDFLLIRTDVWNCSSLRLMYAFTGSSAEPVIHVCPFPEC